MSLPKKPLNQSSSSPLLIWTGDAGLPTSYWVYGVVGGLAWSIAISAMHLTPGSTLAKVTLLSMLVYMIAANVGIWRAANRYQGRKAWVSLSKAAVLFVPLILAISVVAAYFA